MPADTPQSPNYPYCGGGRRLGSPFSEISVLLQGLAQSLGYLAGRQDNSMGSNSPGPTLTYGGCT